MKKFAAAFTSGAICTYIAQCTLGVLEWPPKAVGAALGVALGICILIMWSAPRE